MLKYILIFIIFLSGCNIQPLSPKSNQKIDNAQGQIDEIKSNQNGIMLELGKIKNQNELNAKEIRDAQQGIINIKGNDNSGIQILQGDGALIMVFATLVIGMMLIFYYRSKYIKFEKSTDILTQQVAMSQDSDLKYKVYMASLNTNVETEIYKKIKKHENKLTVN